MFKAISNAFWATATAFLFATQANVALAGSSGPVPLSADVGVTLQLDPTDGPIWQPGQQLSPTWSWVTRPATSVADFSDTAALRPEFTPDVAGTWTALVEFVDVSDPGAGVVSSATLQISTETLAPVAQVVARGIPDGGSPIILDGSSSFDVDGDALTYAWTIVNTPVGSAAAIADATSPIAELSMDLEGLYTVELSVQDSTGLSSAPEAFDVTYLPFGGRTDVYRLNYDVTWPAGGAGGSTFDLGDRSSGAGTHDLIQAFRLDDGVNVEVDSLVVTLDTISYSASTPAEFLALIDVLVLDTLESTRVLVSPDASVSELTFVFDDGNGSVTVQGILGTALTRDDVIDRGAGVYEGTGGRQVAPVASGRFDQLSASINTPLLLEPYASIDIDGSVLAAEASVVYAPTGATVTLDTDIDGLTTFSADTSGDYLIGYRVMDESHEATDQLLISVAGDNIRPSAKIEPVVSSTLNAPVSLDGSQSFDFDGDLLTYDWALLTAPVGSTATITDSQSPFASITPDLSGLYVIQLITDDGTASSHPVTLPLQVENGFPIAEAGPDLLSGSLGQIQLDGSLSSGGALSYNWSSIGLTGDGSASSITGENTSSPTLSLAVREGRFRDVIKLASVYHFKRSDTGGLCQFDVRLPGDVAGASSTEPVFITLHGRGKQQTSAGEIQVWEIENKNQFTRSVTLEDENGVAYGTWSVPGRVSIHVTTPAIGKNDLMYALVDGSIEAQDDSAKNSFSRNNPVCTGPGSGVVQLIVADANGISLADTAFIGNANLRPVLSLAADIELVTGETTTLTAPPLGFDGNGDALTFGWSLLSKPSGSAASIDVDPLVKIVSGDTIQFAPDLIGFYLIQLTANDGAFDAEPVVLLVEVINSPPTAVASNPADVFVGEIASLDGSGSFDPDGNALSYSWTIVSAPSASTATIADNTLAIANFTPDRRGTYVFELEVSDFEFSDTTQVILTVPNRAPVAAIEGPTEASPGDTTSFSALSSTDPDNDELTYAFAVTSAPVGSAFNLAEPVDGEAELTFDLAGDYTLETTASDGLLESTASLTITVTDQQLGPVLGNILDLYTVELGLEFALDLTAVDPDNDPLTFYASPLPLPTGITLDATTGAVRFRPEAGQLGQYSFTVGVSDGFLTDEATLNIEVVAATAGDTSVFGRVFDASDFANGIETPLAGIPVRLRDNATMDITDAAGNFDLGSLSAAGSDLILIEPSANGGPGGYLGTTREITVTANQNRDLSPDFLLTPLNDGCVTVVAGAETILNGTNSGVSVRIAPDSILDGNGAIYTGEVCLGTLPQLAQVSGFPEGTQACNIYGVEAVGATFSQGLQITAPNNDILPDATRLRLVQQDLTTGIFSGSTDAFVDPGAVTVSATAGSYAAGSLFTFLPQAPSSMAGGDEPTGNRMLTVFQGDLNEVYTLPGYRAFNQVQDVGLSYHSQAADLTTVVSGDVTIASDASLPVTLSTILNVGGLSISDTRAWTPRLGINGQTPALIGEEVVLSQSSSFDATGFASGKYSYQFAAAAKYECSTVASSHTSDVYIQNQVDSPYGTGWAIDDLQTLTVADDGTVAIIDDDEVAVFEREDQDIFDLSADPIVFPALGVQGVVVTDLDLDGDPDVAFANTGTGEIKTLINNAPNDFSFGTDYLVATPANVPPTGTYTPNLSSLELGELDGDGIDDLVFLTLSNSEISYLRNVGGVLTEQSISVGPGSITDLDTGALGATDRDSVAWVSKVGCGFLLNCYRSVVATKQANGSFSFANSPNVNQESSFFRPERPRQVLLGDLDADDDLDMALRNPARSGAFGIGFFFNTGGVLSEYLEANLPAGTTGFLGNYMALGDLDGDGLSEVVASEGNDIRIFFNEGNRQFSAPVVLPKPASITGLPFVFIEDLNLDGAADILVTRSGTLAVFPGNGDGTFGPIEEEVLGQQTDFIEIVDINGDGRLDIISGEQLTVTLDVSDPSKGTPYVGSAGEFSTLTSFPDGTWERRYKDGTIVEFNSSGLQTAMVDTQGNRTEYTYDAENRLVSKSDQVGGTTAFVYGADGLLDSITYPDGRVTTFSHDQFGYLEEITEPTSSIVTFGYDENGRLINTTNQNGNITTYNFDALGYMSGATLPDNSEINNQVAASLGLVDGLGGPATQPLIYVAPEDRVTTVTDRKGEITEVEVNEFGSVIRVTDPLGRTTRMTRDFDNLVVQVERPSDVAAGGVRVDAIGYDDRANVISFTEAFGSPEERTTGYEYEPVFNKVTKMTDPDGFDMVYEYDAFGETTKIIDGELGERLFSYTPEGQLLSRTDENGNQTDFAYDTATLNLAQITYADGSITGMTYDTSGNATNIAEAQGTPIERQIQRTYDALNRVLTVEVTGADGAQIDGLTAYTYEPNGNLSTVTDETNLVTTMGYDALERLTSVDDPAEGLIQRTYNTAGEVTQHINGDGEVHTYAYDEVSRLTQTTDPEGFIKSFAYDVRDNIGSVTDGRGGETTFGYDTLDRMTTRTNPIAQTMTRAYDGRDNLTTLIREDGVSETATYDGLSRRTQVVTPDNTLTYAYDPRSNLTEAADDDSRVTFTYDVRNRLETTTTDGTVGPQPQVTLNYTYDALDRRLTMSDSLGGTTTYAWDPEDRLTDLTAPWGTIYSFGYDGEGRRTSLTSTSGRASTYGYTNGLLSALQHAQSGVALTDLTYLYDVDGQLTEIVDNLDPSASKAISYDMLNRLVQVAEGIPASQGGVPVPVEDYAYDEEGNRTSSHLSALYASNAHNQLTEDADYLYAYDTKGNRVSRTEKASGDVETYTYDSQNRLVGYVSPTTTASYAYDALDRRIAKTVDGAVESFVYDPWDPYSPIANDVLLDFEAGALVKRWLHGTNVDEPLAFENYNGTTAGGSGTAHEMFADRLGSITEVVEAATNTVAASYEYDSFGQRSAIGLSQRYGFTAREVDDESGLMYFRARHYDPTLGQFVQRDPIGFAAGDLNLYAYVWNDPFNWTDPSGLVSTTDYLVGTAGVGLAAAAYCQASGACASASDGFGDIFEGAGDALPEPPPSSVLAPTLPIASGLGALMQNAFAALNQAVEEWWNKAAGDEGTAPPGGPGTTNDGTVAAGGTPPGGGPEDDKDQKDSQRIKKSKDADKIAKDLGADDAHDLKKYVLKDVGRGGEPVSRYDIFVNKLSGNVYLKDKAGDIVIWAGRL